MSWRMLGACLMISLAFAISVAKADDETALMAAVRSGQLAKVKSLARTHKAVQLRNAEGDTALLLAVSLEGLQNQAQIVEALVLAGSSLDQAGSLGQTAPEIAVEKNQGAIILSLGKRNKAWVQKKSADGSTLLILAAKLGNTDSVKALLKLGAEKQARDNKGKTAKDHAIEMKFKETAKLL